MFSSRKSAAPSGGYNLTNSLRFRSSASAYLSRTPASTTNQKTWTFSAWVKRGALANGVLLGTETVLAQTYCTIYYVSDKIYLDAANSNVETMRVYTNAVFRDPSAWYHVVVFLDTTQATASNRTAIYVNGVLQTLTVSTNPAQNLQPLINSTVAHNIGRNPLNGIYFDGYLAEVNFIDGQALTPSSFGATSAATGVWQPIKYTGTYGTNGFYLPFTDNSALTTSSNVGLGKDFSGNGNYWVTNNISITSGSTYDSMTDVPTNTNSNTANYCVLNPLEENLSGLSVTLSNGNLTASGTTYGATVYKATMQLPTSGKWYYEFSYSTLSTVAAVGIRSYTTSSTDVQYRSDGQKTVGGTTSSYGSSWTTSDVIGVAIDVGAGTITFYKNNVSQGAINIPTPTATFNFAWNYVTFASTTFSVNFGQRPFSYTPPSGFVALNTFNLPTPTIGATASTQANKYMDATLYTGNGSTNNIVNAGGFAPDLVWTKERSGAGNHMLGDIVRGTNNTLFSNNALAAYTDRGVDSFNSNGFTYSGTEGGDGNVNGSTYVAWQWKGGGTGVTNTAGSITSTVSANTTAGFSIVTYTGTGALATVGHGLGVAPSWVIIKKRSSATNSNWVIGNSASGWTGQLYFDTGAFSTNSGSFNNTAPTSSVFTINTDSTVNASTATYVAYCFAQISGYSAFGSYTGNGSSDGPFIYTGFRPKWILIKRSDSGAESWYLWDTARDTYNVMQTTLLPNSANAESTGLSRYIDALSNGFKIRSTDTLCNASGGTYIYAVFAEFPYKFSLAR